MRKFKDLLIKNKRPRVLLLATAIILFLSSRFIAAESPLVPAMVGTWEGNGRIIVSWCAQTNLNLRLTIAGDGTVMGKVGDAVLKNGKFKKNRGALGRKLNLKTDFLISGELVGPIVAAEGITRSGVNIPLNWKNKRFSGGLHTTGNKFGGKKSMVLSAASLQLSRSVDEPQK